LITITASEKKVIAEMLPRVHIVRTMKSKSKRHHYYMAEEPAAMRLLAKLRGTHK